MTSGLPVILPRRITRRQASKDLSGAHVQMVHCECANGELLNASLQNSQTPDSHCTHRDCTDRRRTKSECPDRQCAHGGAAVSIASSTLRLGHRSLPFPPRLMLGLPLTQNWIGKSFVHAICGPYLQRCGNKL